MLEHPPHVDVDSSSSDLVSEVDEISSSGSSVPRATGIGSHPGEEMAEVVRVVLGELADSGSLPYLPELPARGVHAAMIGRTSGVVADLGFDLQPAGWRLTDRPGIDHRRARSLLAQDLDTLEELGQGLAAVDRGFKVQVAGPWTMAAMVERPRGDKLLADHGARRELAQALGAGLAAHVSEVRRRLGINRIVVQLDEPALPAVLAARIPTASGHGRHRRVDVPEASGALAEVISGLPDGVEVVAHCCAADAPVALLAGAGAQGVSIDLSVIGAEPLDQLGTLLDAGGFAYLGVLDSTGGASLPGDSAVVDRVRRVLDMLGFDPAEVAGRLVLTPSCGFAGATSDYARAALARLRSSAARIVD